MKTLAVKAVELRRAAEYLFLEIVETHCLPGSDVQDLRSPGAPNPRDKRYRRWIELAGAIGGKRSPELSEDLQAIVGILRAHLQWDPPGEAAALLWLNDAEHPLLPALDRLRGILNSPIEKVHLAALAFMPHLWCVLPSGPRIRSAGEALVRFLAMFGEEPRLARQNPLAICPECDGIFVKRKSHQKHCDSKCRFASWARRKLAKSPRYFAKKEASRRKLIAATLGLRRKAKKHLPKGQKKA